MEAQLAATRKNLDQVQAQLDKALLAQSVANLQARQAALQEQLTSLDVELTHKKPLFARSVDLSREIATFDEQLRSLTAQRAERAKEFSDVVTRIEQPAPGQGAGARQETGSADGNRSGPNVKRSGTRAAIGSGEGVARAAGE